MFRYSGQDLSTQHRIEIDSPWSKNSCYVNGNESLRHNGFIHQLNAKTLPLRFEGERNVYKRPTVESRRHSGFLSFYSNANENF